MKIEKLIPKTKIENFEHAKDIWNQSELTIFVGVYDFSVENFLKYFIQNYKFKEDVENAFQAFILDTHANLKYVMFG